MSIQTDGIRHFVSRRAHKPWRVADNAVLVVGSGKGGTGGSTVSALLALAMSEGGRRTLLIDSDELVGTLHRLFGIDVPVGLQGLRSGTQTPSDAIVTLTNRLSLLPGGPGPDAFLAENTAALSTDERRVLVRRIGLLYGNYDVVIVDAGSRLDAVLAAASSGVQRFVLVTATDSVALAATYALVKAIDHKYPGAPVDLLVNRHEDSRARAAFDHLGAASSRFLGRGIEYAGTIPEDDGLRAAILAGRSLGQCADNSQAGHASQVVAERLLRHLDACGEPAAHRTNHGRR